MKTWNLGIIGTGVIADFHARAIADLPNACLVACCSRTFDKAKAFGDKYGCRVYASYEQLLADKAVDIVMAS